MRPSRAKRHRGAGRAVRGSGLRRGVRRRLGRSETGAALTRLALALRAGGPLYASFELGEAEGERGGRWFTDWTEDALTDVVARQSALETIRAWRTADPRPGRGG